jgi:anti-anti-sigma factor
MSGYYGCVTQEDRFASAPGHTSKAVVVQLTGEFDLATKDLLRAQLDRLAGVRDVWLDCIGVSYIDSTAITELIRLHKVRTENGFDTETVVLGENMALRRLFTILQLESLFRIPADGELPDPRAVDIAHTKVTASDGRFDVDG